MEYLTAQNRVREYAGAGYGSLQGETVRNHLKQACRDVHHELAHRFGDLLVVEETLTWPAYTDHQDYTDPKVAPLLMRSVGYRPYGSTSTTEYVAAQPCVLVERDARLGFDASEELQFYYQHTGFAFYFLPMSANPVEIRKRVIYPYMEPSADSDLILRRTLNTTPTADASSVLNMLDDVACLRAASTLRVLAGLPPDSLEGRLKDRESWAWGNLQTQVQTVARIPTAGR